MSDAPTRGGIDPLAPLWRAAQVFRLISCIYALGFHIAMNEDLDRPVLGAMLFGVLMVWSIACAVAYLQGFGRRPAWVITEIVVVLTLIMSTEIVASDRWAAENQSWPTTLWATNATMSAALQFGPIGGMATGLAVIAASATLKGYINIDLGRNATVVIEVCVGLAVGMAALTARRAHAELTCAAKMAAALEERERLSRHVHDGVIQVLALVARRGREIGGDTLQLAVLAGEQERQLRRLVSATDIDVGSSTCTDLGALLRRSACDRVSVSVPGDPVMLPDASAAELLAAVENALDNAAAHAGPDARVFVLLEDLGEAVVVSVRDDGVGIPDGRLTQAARQGRMGISKSIVGRMEWLGGRAQLHTEPGGGTEWELTLPRRPETHSQ